MSDVIIERMLDRDAEGHERYMKIFLVLAHSADSQAAVYSLGALANLCCCRDAVELFFELEGPRHLKEVVLPSRHQLAHPFALIVSAVTGEQFEGGLGLPKATLDAVNRVVDAALLPPLLVFASLPATGAQGQQVPPSAPAASCLPLTAPHQLCAAALKHMKSVRRDLPGCMDEAMAMPHVVQVRARLLLLLLLLMPPPPSLCAVLTVHARP
jgi:hypothetical protein